MVSFFRIFLTIELSILTYALINSNFNVNQAIVEFVKVNIQLFGSIKELILSIIK